jgi:hypothetical protein
MTLDSDAEQYFLTVCLDLTKTAGIGLCRTKYGHITAVSDWKVLGNFLHVPVHASHNILRLPVAIFLKLQESIFLLHATRCSSNMGRYVKRSARGLPNNLLPNFPEILWAIAASN